MIMLKKRIGILLLLLNILILCSSQIYAAESQNVHVTFYCIADNIEIMDANKSTNSFRIVRDSHVLLVTAPTRQLSTGRDYDLALIMSDQWRTDVLYTIQINIGPAVIFEHKTYKPVILTNFTIPYQVDLMQILSEQGMVFNDNYEPVVGSLVVFADDVQVFQEQLWFSL